MIFLKLKMLPMLIKYWKVALIACLIVGIGYYHWDRSRQIEKLGKQLYNCQKAMDENIILNKQLIKQSKIDSQKLVQRAERERQLLTVRHDADLLLLKSKPLAASCNDAMNELWENR